VYIVLRVKGGFLEKIKVARTRTMRVVMRLVGVGLVMGMAVLCFIPFKMTMINVERLDRSVGVNCELAC